MKIYSDKETCCGCRACEQTCPINCITMQSDEEGFFYPVVDESRCIQCGKCQRVCEKIETVIEPECSGVYAVKNKDYEIREKSTSGGVFFELGKKIIDDGGTVFGAVFDEDYRVHHVGVNSIGNLEKMCGSKYVQSDTEQTYSETKKILEEKKMVLYSGTPCQIAGLRSFLDKEYDNLICVSVICHGVPSPEIWKQYLEYKEFLLKEKIVNIQHRDKKRTGWRTADFVLEFEKESFRETFTENTYVKGFLQNLYLRESCFACRAKGIDKGADIIIGDYWGIERCHPSMDDNRGVSVTIINSQKGNALFTEIRAQLEVTLSELNYIERENEMLIKSADRNIKRERFFDELRYNHNIEKSIEHNLKLPLDKETRSQYLYPIIMKYLQNIINGYDVSDFFETKGYRRVALYAVTDLTRILVQDINRYSSAVTVKCICDRNANAFENKVLDYNVIGLEQLLEQYQSGDIDCVVIGNVFAENAIFKSLLSKGIPQERILSINSVIFGFGD